METKELIKNILESFYKGDIPETCNHHFIWKDEFIITLQWTETESGNTRTFKFIGYSENDKSRGKQNRYQL